MIDISPTRAAALARLDAFATKMGRAYASRRNYDPGPDGTEAEGRRVVSVLSPWIRRRLITEQEVTACALNAHGFDKAEKFISEVFWRTYFKGWLERRPTVWADYVQGRGEDLNAMAAKPALAKRIAKAEAGHTGIECFDAWAQELVETHYLHNHTRMWFASIWIFTLGLPWRIGADFFLRHLLDGDPASNTLSWRWVAGLHTRGKHYLADASNIHRLTEGRFHPAAGELNETAGPLEEAFDYGDALPVREFTPYDPSQPAAFLITEDDCLPDTLGLDLAGLLGVATLHTAEARSPRPVAKAVSAFDTGAMADAASRTGHDAPMLLHTDDLIKWAKSTGATQIVTAFVPTGYTRDRLSAALPALEAQGITHTEILRDWDHMIWPKATAGFFKVKKAMPKTLEALGMEV